VQYGVWTFARGADKLEISRQNLDDGTVLAIAGDGEPRSYFFREIERIETFQRDMETLLLKTGWSFVSYAPDKRAGRDRRGWPRRSNDRRRWWTDGRTTKSTTSPGSDASPVRGQERPRTSEKT
jgi:hypothetical protein